MRFAFREVSRNFNERTFEGTYGPLARYRFAAENRGNEGQYAHRKGQWQRRYGMSWRYFTLRHPNNPNVVTVSGKPSLDMKPGTYNNILKRAGLK